MPIANGMPSLLRLLTWLRILGFPCFSFDGYLEQLAEPRKMLHLLLQLLWRVQMKSQMKRSRGRGPEKSWAWEPLFPWGWGAPSPWHVEVFTDMEDSLGSLIWESVWRFHHVGMTEEILGHWWLNSNSSPSSLLRVREWGWKFQPSGHGLVFPATNPHPKASPKSPH